MQEYLTIKQNGEAEIIIKKSKFICHLARSNDEFEAKMFIETIKAKHFHATHNCFAYTIGLNDEIQRESDNGEPARTAGVPILDVLKKMHLHNTTAVVTRYFGGIKLGTGGLIRAYSSATSNAINSIGIVKKTIFEELEITIAYNLQGKLENFLQNNDLKISNTKYTELVTLCVLAPPRLSDKIQKQIFDLLNSKVSFKIGKQKYFEIDYKKR